MSKQRKLFLVTMLIIAIMLMYSTITLADQKSDSLYCLNKDEVKKISEAIQSLKFCETDLERLKILKAQNQTIIDSTFKVYETDDLIISFSVGMFAGILLYKEIERINYRRD